ncbi:MAG TPA: hypothetical protein VL995_09675 [Cellvibrio sp.]|nr:hypothetical protein [Cellvibrio sp.]
MKINNLGIFCDDLGNEYVVIEEIQERTHKPLGKPQVTLEGSKSYRTQCGEHLNFSKGIFITLDNVALKPKAS